MCVCVRVVCASMRSPFKSLKLIKTVQILVQFSFFGGDLTSRRETWVRKKLSAEESEVLLVDVVHKRFIENSPI